VSVCLIVELLRNRQATMPPHNVRGTDPLPHNSRVRIARYLSNLHFLLFTHHRKPNKASSPHSFTFINNLQTGSGHSHSFKFNFQTFTLLTSSTFDQSQSLQTTTLLSPPNKQQATMSSTMTKTSLFAAVLAMASTASAHMFIASPVPFAGVSKSPLLEDGSNFPCQGSSYEITTMNDWAAGSDVTVSFPPDQTATHSGGSCQISVTKDEKPTKDSKWKVIHSIEGLGSRFLNHSLRAR
jgi:hypothetical protein